MKVFLILTVFLAGLSVLSGCSDTEKTVSSAAEKTLELPDRARVVSDLGKLRTAVGMYYAQNEYYPANLDELKIKTECPLEDYIYDSATGKVNNRYFSQL